MGSGIQISGGGLTEAYDSLQFHLHWGNGSSGPGSEHTVDGKRYAMEVKSHTSLWAITSTSTNSALNIFVFLQLHIVNSKSSYNGNTTLATEDSTGLAALGFFIEVRKYACTFLSFQCICQKSNVKSKFKFLLMHFLHYLKVHNFFANVGLLLNHLQG